MLLILSCFRGKDMILQSVECSHNVCKLVGGVGCCHMCSLHFFGRFHHFEAYPFKLSSFCDCIFFAKQNKWTFPSSLPIVAGFRFRVGPPGVRSSSEIWNKLLGNCLRWLHDTRWCISRGCKILHDVAWICFSGDICTENPMVNHPKKNAHTHTKS